MIMKVCGGRMLCSFNFISWKYVLIISKPNYRLQLWKIF